MGFVGASVFGVISKNTSSGLSRFRTVEVSVDGVADSSMNDVVDGCEGVLGR